jgi:hypothetical protein
VWGERGDQKEQAAKKLGQVARHQRLLCPAPLPMCLALGNAFCGSQRLARRSARSGDSRGAQSVDFVRVSALLCQQPLDAGQRRGEVFGHLRPALELAPHVAKDRTEAGLEASDLAGDHGRTGWQSAAPSCLA